MFCMKFEVVNDKNKVVMNTSDVSCIPDTKTLNIMHKAGYSFKLDNKKVSIKKLSELLKGENENDGRKN